MEDNASTLHRFLSNLLCRAAVKENEGPDRVAGVDHERRLWPPERQWFFCRTLVSDMPNAKTVTVYGTTARSIEELARTCPTHTEHRVGVAALRVGLRRLVEQPELLDQELAAMARHRSEACP